MWRKVLARPTNLGAGDAAHTTGQVLHVDEEIAVDVSDERVAASAHEGVVEAVEGRVVRVSRGPAHFGTILVFQQLPRAILAFAVRSKECHFSLQVMNTMLASQFRKHNFSPTS